MDKQENITNHNSQDLQSISQTPRDDFDFDDKNWFENWPLFVINTLAKTKKKISNFVAVSTLHKLAVGVYNRHM